MSGRRTGIGRALTTIRGPNMAAVVAIILAAVTSAVQAEVESQKLTASDQAAEDFFGRGVAVSRDWAAIGSARDQQTGVDPGSVYMFWRDDQGTADPHDDRWVQSQRLVASDTQESDSFGTHLAIRGDFLVVGAIFNDAAAADGGAAFIFQRQNLGDPQSLSDDLWVEVSKLTPSDPQINGFFGAGVAIHEDRLLVGACIGGNSGIGAAYVYRPSSPFDPVDDVWIEEAKLVAFDGKASERFGCSGLAIDRDWILVSADDDDSVCPGQPSCFSGSVYLFRRSDGGTANDPTDDTWSQAGKLVANDVSPKGAFGRGLSMDGPWAIIGMPENLEDNGVGAAYIFLRDDQGTPLDPTDDVWSERAKLVAPDPGLFDMFGESVSIHGDTAVVGAFGHELDGCPEPDDVCDLGAVYRYERNTNATPDDPTDDTWEFKSKLSASDGTPGFWENDGIVSGDQLGRPVSVFDNWLFAGAQYVDDACPWDAGCNSGAAYAFSFEIGPGPPCAPCPYEDPANCQLLDDAIDGSVAGVSDLSAPGGPMLRADDFVPTGNSISSVCVWGAYQDTTDPDGDGFIECVDVQPDRFRVQIYVDDGGRPGTLLAGSTRTVITPDRCIREDSGYQIYDPNTFGEAYAYHLEFEPPIAVTADTTYWIEVANDTGADFEGGEEHNNCAWVWLTAATAGNGVSWSGIDVGGVGVYGGQTAKPLDLAMCIDTGLGPLPDPIEAPCCTCSGEGATCSETPFDVCIATKDRWDANIADCTVAGCGEAVPGDDGATDMIEVTGDQVSVEFDTTCATVDGAANLPGGDLEPMTMGPDIWVAYTATCTGSVIGSMCSVESEYDSALAVYHDSTNPTVCTFPGTSIDTLSGLATDEGCNGQGDGGAGWLSRVTLSGDCWLFRIGAYGLDHGPGRLDIQCRPDAVCTPSQAPVVPHLAIDQQNPPELGPDIANRFLALEFPEGGQKAIRVTFTALPTPYEVWNGQSMWVSPPGSVSENGSSITPIPGFDNFPVSTLTCGTPHFTNWQALGTLYITHEAIRPGGLFRVQIIDESCSVNVESNFSAPLEFSNAIFGDTVKDLSFTPPPPPDGSVAIIDVFSVVNAFLTAPGAIRKYRAEFEPKCPDLLVNITDILDGIGALQGLNPANSAPNDPDVCNSGCSIFLPPLLP